jgi:hypothetical protein
MPAILPEKCSHLSETAFEQVQLLPESPKLCEQAFALNRAHASIFARNRIIRISAQIASHG